MKKVIGLALAAIAVLIVGILIMNRVVSKKYEIVIPSVDGIVHVSFGTVGAQKRIGQMTYQEHSFTIAESVSLWNDSIKQHPGYLYSLDDENKRCMEETGKYLLCLEGHYFLVLSDYDNSSVLVREQVFDRWYSDPYNYMAFIFLPFTNVSINGSNEFIFSWKDTVGITNFEELIEFYKRADEDLFRIEETERTIFIYSGDSRIKEPLAELKANDDSLLLKISEELPISQ